MLTNVYFVFSSPPPGVTDEEFHAWYDRHVTEIVAGPGFAAARRYDLEAVVGDRSPTMYRHLALYEFDGEPRAALAALDERVQAGEIALKPWFSEIRFASFYGHALEDAEVHAPEQAYLVFSQPPQTIGFDDYSRWYATHLRENLTADGFDAGWRFRLEPDTLDPDAPCEAVHAAVYEVHGELAALRAALVEARQDGRVHFPEWFDQIQFASLHCLGASDRVRPAVMQ